jgi:hypothetical protein
MIVHLGHYRNVYISIVGLLIPEIPYISQGKVRREDRRYL